MIDNAPRAIFNISAVLAKQARARRLSINNNADFLALRAAGDIVDRLNATNREFADALEIFPMSKQVSNLLAGSEKIGHLSQLDRKDVKATENLGLKPNSLDLVISVLSLHWQNDLPGCFVQIARALRPDGLFMAVFPGEDTLHELRESLIAAELELLDGISPRVDPFAEIRQLGALLQRAGFALPVADSDRVTVRYDNLKALTNDLRAMGATSSLFANKKYPGKSFFEFAQTNYEISHAHADGRLPATFTMVHLSGWSPHESQQKPLAPGSARTSLSDVL